jgi:hypothetical protein
MLQSVNTITQSSENQITAITNDSTVDKAQTELSQNKVTPVSSKIMNQEVSVTFSQAERNILRLCIDDMVNNPRKIKRIINIYRLARLLKPSAIDVNKLVPWILMTEQWPLHVAWIIKTIEDDTHDEKKWMSKTITYGDK